MELNKLRTRVGKFYVQLEFPVYVINISTKSERFYSSLILFDIDGDISFSDCLAPINIAAGLSPQQIGTIYSLHKIPKRNRGYRIYITVDSEQAITFPPQYVDVSEYTRLEIDVAKTESTEFCDLFLNQTGISCSAREATVPTVIKLPSTKETIELTEIINKLPTLVVVSEDIFVGMKGSVNSKMVEPVYAYAQSNNFECYAYLDGKPFRVVGSVDLPKPDLPILSLEQLVNHTVEKIEESKASSVIQSPVTIDTKIPAMIMDVNKPQPEKSGDGLKCLYCDRSFTKKFGLSNHVRSKHPDKYGEYNG